MEQEQTQPEGIKVPEGRIQTAPEEPKPKLTKTVRALRITFVILIIAWILLLGGWLAQLIKISFS